VRGWHSHSLGSESTAALFDTQKCNTMGGCGVAGRGAGLDRSIQSLRSRNRFLRRMHSSVVGPTAMNMPNAPGR
jgi:hypothetical protein